MYEQDNHRANSGGALRTPGNPSCVDAAEIIFETRAILPVNPRREKT
jgi:hypothetical protein